MKSQNELFQIGKWGANLLDTPYYWDILSELYDSDFNFICSLDGKIIGNRDTKCPDFLSSPKREKLD